MSGKVELRMWLIRVGEDCPFGGCFAIKGVPESARDCRESSSSTISGWVQLRGFG